MTLKWRLLLTASTLMFMVACGQRTETQRYNHNGFTAVIPADWKKTTDTENSLFADREISFKTGDYSFVGFYIFEPPSGEAAQQHSHSDLLKRFLKFAVPETSTPDMAKVRESKLERAGIRGTHLDITTSSLVDLETVVEAFTKEFDGRTLFIAFYTEKNHATTVEPQIAHIIKSAELLEP